MRVYRQKTLRQVAIFNSLSDGELRELENVGHWLQVKPKDVIYSVGERVTEVFFLVEGDVTLNVFSRCGKLVHLQNAEAVQVYGNVTGEEGMSAVGLEATTPCLLLAVRTAQFLKFLADRPAVGFALMRQFAAQNRAIVGQVVELSTFSVRRRVHAELLRRARRLEMGGRAVLPETLTHSEIALSIGTNRETVTRELRRLQTLGLLVKDGAALMLPDVSRLGNGAP